MRLSASSFSGRVTFITGPGKDSGKTTLLGHAQSLLRAAGEAPAVLGVGFDGEARDALSSSRKPRVRIERGECLVTALRFLEASGLDPEILAELGQRGGFGRLAAARAGRGGDTVLVGPEGNARTAEAIAALREEGGARTVLVDGAMNRLTQVADVPGARFLVALRVGPAELGERVSGMRLMGRLAALPAAGGGAPAGGAAGTRLELKGPLTAEVAARLAPEVEELVVEDLTKVFLDERGLGSLLRRRRLAVRRPLDFVGFVVALRDLSRGAFLDALAEPDIAGLVAWNPFEVEAAAHA